MRTLFEYSKMQKLRIEEREKKHKEIVEMILNDKDKYHSDIEEMIDYFITEMGNADFIRLVDNIKGKK